MKKIAVTIGLAAIGATSIHAAYAPDKSGDKTWSVSATLRGFYDDNYGATGVDPRGGFGGELTPQFQIVKPLNQTELGLRYIYALFYYETRDHLNQNAYDQNHWVNLWLDHVFNEKWETKLSDSITVTQDPQLLSAGSAASTFPFRADGNYIYNNATASLHTDWTRRLGTVLTYNNQLYTFDQTGSQSADNIKAGQTPSYAGQFDRMDQALTADLQWHASTETIWGVGYTFDWVGFSGNEPISYYPAKDQVFYSDYRNSYTHTFFLSYQHNLTDSVKFTAMAGGQLNDNYNDISQKSTPVSPYADISATYLYKPGSSLQFGFTHSLNTSYLPVLNGTTANTNNGSISEYQESSTVYLNINHQITPKLLALVGGRYQNASFQEGPFASQSENYYSAVANLSYSFTRHFSFELGYNYTQVESVQVGTSYRRNQYSVAITGSY